MKRKLEGSNTVKIEVVENKHISDLLCKISNAINHDFFINSLNNEFWTIC